MAFAAWRTTKLKMAEKSLTHAPVEVENLSHPTESERESLIGRCRATNFARYASDPSGGSEQALRDFAAAFRLRIAETHRSAGESGIVALRVTDEAGKRGYIPYSSRSMNWHTDGYYNHPDEQISGFVLHCVRPAGSGGANRILDPEIAYLRLRDENPGYVRALMHAQAMTIPENREADGSLRPESVGPVFYPDPGTGRLQMRYTARTRSIEWRDDPETRDAVAFLGDILTSGDPLAHDVRLSAGQGILNNNVLHNRTGFDDGPDHDSARVIFRVRFHNRVGERTWRN